MFARVRLWTASLSIALFMLAAAPARSQSSSLDTIVHPADAAKLLPAQVFFRGQSAPLQARNSGGIKFSDGMYLLAALVDSSGYSTAVQQKYQAYLFAEVAIEINGHPLPAGAYGSGFVAGNFEVMDIGNHTLFSVAATHDDALKRPMPLQVMAESAAGKYRLYQGRDYVVVSRAAQ